MGLEATRTAAETFLIWPIRTIWKVAYAALLRRIGTFDSGGPYPSFGGVPGNLLWNVR